MSNTHRSRATGKSRKHRRGSLRRASGRNLEIFHGPEAGPGIEQAPLEEVIAALTAHGEELDWASVSRNVLPVMPRVRPYPPSMPEPLQTYVPPGIVVGFGIDIGPAFLNVNADLFASWPVDLADLTAAAVANVHTRAATVKRSAIHAGQIGEHATEWLQTGVSVGSTLVLAPTELRRIFDGPRFFITPMRDLIIGLPFDVDRAAALWLYHEVADLDPNCLGPLAFAFDGVRVVPEPLETGGAGRPIQPTDQSPMLA